MQRGTTQCCGPITRRSFLQVGSLAAGGLTLSGLLRARALAAEAGRTMPDTSVILVWLPGGLPHMEMYDMKPQAPSDYRGEFSPIKTNVSGIEVCEHLPLHAKCADKYSLIRSISHTFADHGGGHKRFLTGRIPAEPFGTLNDNPSVQSIVARCREGQGGGLPPSVAFADTGREGVDIYAFGSAYLGGSYAPFMVAGDPSAADFKVKSLELAPGMAARLDDRRRLLQGFDRLRRDVDRTGAFQTMDGFNQRAFDLLTSPAARNAFDLSKEDTKVRDRYGHHAWGQRALLSRRLVEAGCGFVTCVMESPMPGKDTPLNTVYNWDCHAVNCHIFEDFKWRAPYFDQAVTALIEDVHARGLDKKVMVIVTGEFGHTPKINAQVGTRNKVTQPGRDHWPQAMSVLVTGGGLRTGQVVGSTNDKGEHPKDRPLTPDDLWATVYRHLGIDPHRTFDDHRGRPQHILPQGEPIRELI